MPIAQEVYNALFEGKSVQRCLIDLLSREQKDELAGFGEWSLQRRRRPLKWFCKVHLTALIRTSRYLTASGSVQRGQAI